ncbi:MAG: FAD-dependent oxidoreductase [Leptolyngbyaceae cyanobacterium RU_5_1]|nr:FAD-dependent oxidoreductase [Leptolyngbyaceae cyanobacterium RU_5_1]
MTSTTLSTPRSYDIIGFGDEVPGVLALVSAAREYRRRTGKNPKTLLMFKGNSLDGIGGHLVRGKLAYLDRSSIPIDIRQSLSLPTFGDPCAIYQEFLQRAGVSQIALDSSKADAALRFMLSDVGADIISRVEIKSVTKSGAKLAGIHLTRGETYLAKQFIDSTVNAELAQAAGVKKLRGFETFGLPESELPVTLVFETEGLSIQQLKDAELAYLKRLVNPNDSEAQRFLMIAAGSNAKLAEQFRKDLLTSSGHLKTLYVGQDHIDVYSRALSIAYHAFRGKRLYLKDSGAILDQGNIAILPNGKLSWNALLFFTTGSQAEALAKGAAKPTPPMLEEFKFIERWFKSLGATAVKPALELYIRHAGNISDTVEPLSGATMLEGGVSASEALGTFGYHLDVRGGIEGLGLKAREKGITSITFHTPPLFNIGIQHALVRSVPNLAVISPASGFDGYACAAGRIVEFNVGVGQGVGIAAAIALLHNRNLATISNLEVRQVLTQTNQLSRIYGKGQYVEATRLAKFESSLGTPAIA